MNIPIEVIGVVAIVLLIVGFSTWKVLSTKLLKRRYKPENDKSRLGQEKRLADLATDTAIRKLESGKIDEARSRLVEKREPVQTTASDQNGQNRIGSGKSRSIIRFRRRK
jgi:hypothetical protein